MKRFYRFAKVFYIRIQRVAEYDRKIYSDDDDNGSCGVFYMYNIIIIIIGKLVSPREVQCCFLKSTSPLYIHSRIDIILRGGDTASKPATTTMTRSLGSQSVSQLLTKMCAKLLRAETYLHTYIYLFIAYFNCVQIYKTHESRLVLGKRIERHSVARHGVDFLLRALNYTLPRYTHISNS